MASYPTSVITFAARANGQTIQDTWFNTLQDEVTAIESGLLNGTAPLNSSNSTVNAMNVTGNCTVAGELFVTQSPPVARVFNAGNVAIANNTPTVPTYDSQLFISTSAMHSTASNPSRVIAPSSGIYVATANVTWNAFSSAGVREVLLLANSTSYMGAHRTRADPSAANVTPMTVTAVWRFQANEWVEMRVTQDSGSTGSISSASLSLVKIR